MLFDCKGRQLRVGDRVLAEPNPDGVAVGIPGVVKGVVRGTKARVEFVEEGVPSVRVVAGVVLCKRP